MCSDDNITACDVISQAFRPYCILEVITGSEGLKERGRDKRAFSSSPRVGAEDTFDGISLVSMFLNPRSECYGTGANSTGETPHITDTLQKNHTHHKHQQLSTNLLFHSECYHPPTSPIPRLPS